MLDKWWLLLLLIAAVSAVERGGASGGQREHTAPKTRAVRGGLQMERRWELGYKEGYPGLR